MLNLEIIFPASPNWYSAHIVDACDGHLAIATNQSVTVVHAASRQVKGVCPVKGKVTAVGLYEGVLCVCSSERYIQAFNLSSLLPVGSHRDHHAEPCALVMVSRACISGDRKGSICFWQILGSQASGGLERIAPQKENVTCLTVCDRGQRLAVGYGSGLAIVVSLESKSVICSFKHRAPVQGLSWVPASEAQCLVSACQDEAVQLWRLSIPSIGVESIMAELSDTLASSRDARGRETSQDSRPWTCVCALPNGIVLYSGFRGQLFSWEHLRKKAQRAAPVHTRPIFGIRRVGGDHVVTAGMDRYVVLWVIGKSGVPEMKWRFCGLGGHVTTMRTDGANMLVVGCGDHAVRFMDLLHREHRQHCWMVWKGLRTPVTSLAPLLTEKMFGYGLQDGSLGVISANSDDGPGGAELLCSLSHSSPITSLCWLRSLFVSTDIPTLEKEPQAGVGKKTKSRKTLKNNETCSIDTSCKAVLKAFWLVSLSANHQVFVTSVDHATGKSHSTALRLMNVLDAAPQPSAVATYSPSLEVGDLLVVAVAHKARKDCLELNSIQVFRSLEGSSVEFECVGALPADGLSGGVTSMSLDAASSESGPFCRVLCGTGKGSLAVIRLPWPPPSAAVQLAGESADEALMQAPAPWPLDAQVRQAHAKGVIDVQWRPCSTSSLLERRMLLSASQDGGLKVWHLTSSPIELVCLHSLAGANQGIGSGLVAACWDSSVAHEAAILVGGRDQVVFRWLPEAAIISPSSNVSPSSEHQGQSTDAKGSVPSVTPKFGSGKLGRSCARQHIAQQTTSASSMLTLASACLYQQSFKARALELVRVCVLFGTTSVREGRASVLGHLWPGNEVPDTSDFSMDLNMASSPSLTCRIFSNLQRFADSWAEIELQHKLKQAASDDNWMFLHRARLLKLWATDVREAVGVDFGASVSNGDIPCLPASWCWLALSPAAGVPSTWQEAMSCIVTAAQHSRTSAYPDAVHYAVAAALGLGKDDEAVRLYIASELFMDAILLARLRFPAHHPLIAYAYEHWAVDLKRRGRCDQAAACHLAAGKLGSALTCIEEWLPPARSFIHGVDPGRYAGSFAAACVAEALVTARLLADVGPGERLTCHEGSELYDGYDATLCYDHKQWWGKPELRAAVLAWKCCIIETLHGGQISEALALARIGPLRCRNLTEGLRFLRAALAGYASALVWWKQLHTQPWDESILCNGTDGAQPLHLFLRESSVSMASDEFDWDFEWLALTWLPGFGPLEKEDPLLVAVVEFARSLASLGSGSTRSVALDDAPWAHIISAVDALLRLAAGPLSMPESSLEVSFSCSATSFVGAKLLVKPLQRLGALVCRSGVAPAPRALGCCVSACARLGVEGLSSSPYVRMEGLERESADVIQWEFVGSVLFGGSGTGEAKSVLQRAHYMTRLISGGTPTIASSMMLVVNRVADTFLSFTGTAVPDLEVVADELRHAASQAVTSCGLQLPQGDGLQSPGFAPSLDNLAADCVQRLKAIHTYCGSLYVVPLSILTWCSRRQVASSHSWPRVHGRQLEYDIAEEGGAEGAMGTPGSAAASLLQTVAVWVAESWGEAETELGEVIDDEVAAELLGVLRLESTESLSWRDRLAFLRRASCMSCHSILLDMLEALDSLVDSAVRVGN